MDEELDAMVISVRADTRGFARDVASMRGELEGPLATGAARAGRLIEGALSRAITSGKFGFDDLKKVALAAMAQIATASLRTMFSSLGGGGQGGGVGGLLASAVSGLVGLPGRATGGPVSAGRGYMVGERGPELFVPGSSGRVERLASGGGGRDVRVSIALSSPAAGDPAVLRQSSRQIAHAVRSAIRNDGR
ncbi:MAG: tail tape measure protein [Sphingomonas sp.]|nr:tail tape measure protein [Sphingomonas sp.]